MIIPAILMKDEIERAFRKKAYTEDIFFYNGWIGNLPNEVKEDEDLWSFAIVDADETKPFGEEYILIGYISFRIDHYSAQAYNFGLIRFEDKAFFTKEGRRIIPESIMAAGILEVIRKLEDMNLHRIEFRCVEGNPAEAGYTKIINRLSNQYRISIMRLEDVCRNSAGGWHDSIIFQLIRRG